MLGRRKKPTQVGRLALRVEGKVWNAYYAMPSTMEGAVWLGSIAMATVADNPERKEAFMDLMRGIVSEFLNDFYQQSVIWPDPPRPAPEHERSGSA
jgi:hypothetical protein